MVKRGLFAFVFVLGISASSANAATLFFEDFNAENGGVGALNYNAFNQFTVSGGTVDLIGNGFFDFLPGNGLYVDLDGSTFDAGLMLADPIPVVAGLHTLFFDLAGSQRGPDESVRLSVFLDAVQISTGFGTFGSAMPFTNFSFAFLVPGPGNLTFQFFEDPANNNNVGLLLDDIRLEGPAIPEPASLLLLGSGLAAIASRRRRRTKH